MGKIIKKEGEVGGRTLSLEVGQLAAQANAAVLARYGETVILSTVVSSQPREEPDFLPLHVDYIEKYYAGGRISTSRFVKRERRPSDEAILTARLVDRSIRPLFPEGYKNEIQVIITVLSYDDENDPAILSLVATSAALAISDIPWGGPIGGTRIGLRNSNFVVNPKNGEIEESHVNLVVSSLKERVVMVEAGANQIEEEKILEAIELAQKENEKIIELINKLTEEAGARKQPFEAKGPPSQLLKDLAKFGKKKIKGVITKSSLVTGGEVGFSQLQEEAIEKFRESYSKEEINAAWQKIFKETVRSMIVLKQRPDGRAPSEIRKLEITVGVLPRTHGSAIFKRGDTQVLSVVTLGAPSLEQWIESMEGEERKRYIHHYNMPPYSIGETSRLGWPSRREIGHGALAERALLPVIPSKEEFPYTIRVVSEVMSSNGSTSMGAVCGSSLALMDAGVPIAAPVAGVALGLVAKGEKRVILTDITGLEDVNGDMDFKVAGTTKGVTALQMDVKIPGIKRETFKKVFAQASKARAEILEEMRKAIAQPRPKLSPHAPKIEVLHIKPEVIGDIIGPGGRVIREIIAKTEVGIDVEDDGVVTISGDTDEAVDKAKRWIEGITRAIEPGEIYEGEVTRIEPYGAFIKIAPGKEGLVHISEMAPHFVRKASDIVKLGQKVKVYVLGIDELGRIKLSMLLGEEKRILPKRPLLDRARIAVDRYHRRRSRRARRPLRRR